MVQTMETSTESSTKLCDTAETTPIRNESGNDIGNANDTTTQTTTGKFVIQMLVHLFTIFGIRIQPGRYQTKLPPSLHQIHTPVTNQDNCADNYQLQEWIHIWKRIKNIQYKHPGYRAPVSMVILLMIYVLFVICVGINRQDFFILYCITVILMNAYCYHKYNKGNRFIMLYWRTILIAITLNTNIVIRKMEYIHYHH
jgi:hypothetical protein